MEQLQELLNLLSKTPEMALWGASIYFLFILLKAASWITAATLVAKLLINRFYDWQELKANTTTEQKKLDLEITKEERAKVESMHNAERVKSDNAMQMRKSFPLYDIVDRETYDGGHSLQKLFLAIGGGKRVHSSDIEKVTSLVIKEKVAKPN